MTHLVDLQVLVQSRPIPQYFKENKLYCEARKGSSYTIQLRNLTWQRLLVNCTVDGLSVMDGKEGSTADPKGYVLNGYETLTIPGWRLSNSEIAEFKFGTKSGSYASKVGKGGNTGVIGVAVYTEMQVPVNISYPYNYQIKDWWSDIYQSGPYKITWSGGSTIGSVALNAVHTTSCNSVPFQNTISSSNAVYVAMDDGKVAGTEFGPKQENKVMETNIQLSSQTPVEIRTIEYKFRPELEKMGIQISPPANVYRADNPSPFPADNQGCKPPPDWKG